MLHINLTSTKLVRYDKYYLKFAMEMFVNYVTHATFQHETQKITPRCRHKNEVTAYGHVTEPHISS